MADPWLYQELGPPPGPLSQPPDLAKGWIACAKYEQARQNRVQIMAERRRIQDKIKKRNLRTDAEFTQTENAKRVKQRRQSAAQVEKAQEDVKQWRERQRNDPFTARAERVKDAVKQKRRTERKRAHKLQLWQAGPDREASLQKAEEPR